MTGQETSEQYLDGYGELLTEVARTGRRLNREELQARRTAGEAAAEAGHSLRSLINVHVAATRAAWPRAGAAAGAGAAERVLALVEQVVDALAEGYERAQRLAVRQEEAFRREFIDDLLHGRSDLGRLAERAERFGLSLAHAHVVAVAEGAQSYGETDPAVRQVEASLHARFGERSLLLTTKDGRLIGIKRPGEDFTYATAETVVEKGDVIVVTGKTRAVEAFAELS
ncbi:TrkA C-terminal domain-containing protein [Streptomyces monticola]|uniref:TrkA C-terminal domain-containing protein n=1 Tax=Streptomyces monticola TaxID=2666263 RepID=A0ABW2JEG4_9ACTN